MSNVEQQFNLVIYFSTFVCLPLLLLPCSRWVRFSLLIRSINAPSHRVENKIFYGHKIVLVTASPRLQSLLSTKVNEGNGTPTVQINDIRYHIFEVSLSAHGTKRFFGVAVSAREGEKDLRLAGEARVNASFSTSTTSESHQLSLIELKHAELKFSIPSVAVGVVNKKIFTFPLSPHLRTPQQTHSVNH